MSDKRVDVEALEETMEEVVETLDLAEQAAEFAESRNPDPTDRARARAVRKQAEAMLDAAEQSSDPQGTEDAPEHSTPDTPRPNGLLH